MLDKHIIPGVENVRQLPNYCGPAVLAAVLNYWGIKISQEQIAKVVFNPHIQATHGNDLLLYCLKLRLKAYSYRGSIFDAKRKVAANLPLIVLQKFSKATPSTHYRIIIGYDNHRAAFAVIDPERENPFWISYRRFMELWLPCGKWTLLIDPTSNEAPQEATTWGNAVLHRNLAVDRLHQWIKLSYLQS
jgi:ABC-type bacteriocin/lantibiotic exporter with double-glycine peptidase domain